MTATPRVLFSILLALLAILGAEAGKYGKTANCGKRNKKCCAVPEHEKPCTEDYTICDWSKRKGQGKCVSCGGNGQWACDVEPKCGSKYVVQHIDGQDVCKPPPCGLYDQQCCAKRYCSEGAGLSCQATDEGHKCKNCGNENDTCCTGKGRHPCNQSDNVCNDGKCKHCGSAGEPCCAGGGCDSGNKCRNGHCVARTCDKEGDHCCTGEKCDGFLNCKVRKNGSGRCKKCGGKNMRCCTHTEHPCDNPEGVKAKNKLECLPAGKSGYKCKPMKKKNKNKKNKNKKNKKKNNTTK